MPNWARHSPKQAPLVYLNRARPLWGFLFGWMSSFLERPVAMANAGSRIFPAICGILVSNCGHGLVQRPSAEVTTSLYRAQPCAALVVLAVTAINLLSVADGWRNSSAVDMS